MVVGRASTGCWGNSDYIREIFPEFGEQKDVVSCGFVYGLVDSSDRVVGGFSSDACLL